MTALHKRVTWHATQAGTHALTCACSAKLFFSQLNPCRQEGRCMLLTLVHTAFTLVLPCASTLVYPYAPPLSTNVHSPCLLTCTDIRLPRGSTPCLPICTCVNRPAGYYGNSQSQTFNESSTSGRDYLAEVCRDWENAAQQAKTKRVVIVRTGIVLAKEGGAMAKMLPIFNIFAGGPLGNGQQWCSWIHRFDVAVWHSMTSFSCHVLPQSLECEPSCDS